MESIHGTLVGTVVSTESLTVTAGDTVTVGMRSGTGPIYFTVDGTTPTVAGADTFVVGFTGYESVTVRVPASNAQTVKLISTTADTYSVVVIDDLAKG